MTFARAKPLGYTDDVDVLPAAEINQIDLNQSRAADMFAGGSYAPAGAFIVNGAGFQSNNILASIVNGAMTFRGGYNVDSTRILNDGSAGNPARMPLRIDTTTIPVNADVTIRPAASVADVYFGGVGSSFTADRTWTISVVGAVVDEMILIATDHSDAAFQVDIVASDAPGSPIGTFLTGSVTHRKWILYRFDGVTWVYVVGGVGATP